MSEQWNELRKSLRLLMSEVAAKLELPELAKELHDGTMPGDRLSALVDRPTAGMEYSFRENPPEAENYAVAANEAVGAALDNLVKIVPDNVQDALAKMGDDRSYRHLQGWRRYLRAVGSYARSVQKELTRGLERVGGGMSDLHELLNKVKRAI